MTGKSGVLGAFAVLGASLASGCDDDPSRPELPPLELEIVFPISGDSAFAGDTLRLVGEAVADDIGLLPDDSLWWSEAQLELGRGRVVEHVISTEGDHTYRFHARYGAREGSTSLELRVRGSGVGTILWTIPLDESGADGLAMSPDGVLYALDRDGHEAVAIAPDGRVLWRSALGAEASGPPAVGPDGSLFYGFSYGSTGERGGVMALRGDGSFKWVFETEDFGPPGSDYYHVHAGAAVGDDGTVYFTSEEDDAPVYAVRPDGTLGWRAATYPFGATRLSGYPVLVGDSLVVVFERRNDIVGVGARDGTLRWKAPIHGYISATAQPAAAVGADGTIYVARSDTLVAFGPDGTEVWRATLDHSMSWGGSPTVGASHIFLGTGAGGVLVLDASGALVSRLGPDWPYAAAATVAADQVVYVAGPDSLFSYNLEGRRFAVAVSHSTGFAAAQGGPLVGPDGTVYLRASAVGVIAIRDTVGPAVDEPWPTFMGGPARRGRSQR